jgi:hypothetical protein
MLEGIARLEVFERCYNTTMPCMHDCIVTTTDMHTIIRKLTAWDLIDNDLWPFVTNKEHFLFMFSILVEVDDLSSFSLFLEYARKQL